MTALLARGEIEKPLVGLRPFDPASDGMWASADVIEATDGRGLAGFGGEALFPSDARPLTLSVRCGLLLGDSAAADGAVACGIAGSC